ncbi:MAG: phosphatidylinositol transfer protein [Nannocystaceae bacterium]|nr:phosphatidylinositol transfer protein [Nannocystaceae bacterium]
MLLRRAHSRWVLVGLIGLAACADDGAPLQGDDGSSSGASSADSGSASASDSASTASATTADDADGSGGSSGASSADSGESSAGEASSSGGTTGCPPPPACDAAPPNPGPLVAWQDLQSIAVVASGGPNHRGRDMIYNPGDAQWVLAKFAYGLTDWDLEGERIDLYLLRDCAGQWESLGSIDTTYEADPHATVEGVEDTGGRVYFQLPAESILGPGRHRVHMVVRGDATTAEAFIEILEPATPIFVADIDGTLTTYETEEFVALLTGALPDVNPNAPEALWALADHGYHPVYLTARPEFLGARTLEFVQQRGLPPGIIHTTLSATGALGSAAETYKTDELAVLADRGLVPGYVFGNTSSDAAAYDNAGIMPLDHRIFFQYDDDFGGRRIEDYGELVDEFTQLDDVCE